MAYLEDLDFTLHLGDVRDVLASLPSESVDCVVTSPPYWGLRDYGTGAWDGGDPGCDHSGSPAISDKSTLAGYTSENIKLGTNTASPYRDICGKCGAVRVDRQLGLEKTPQEYVANLVAVFREVRRVLAPHGTVWLNLGDSYASGGGDDAAGSSDGAVGRGDRPAARIRAGLKPKDLVGVPWRVAFGLQDDGWYLRSDIIWAKPNPMPESVTDRPTKSHEYVFLLSKGPRYFFDQEAVREPAEWARWGDQTNTKHEGAGGSAGWIGSKPKGDLTQRRTAHYNTAERYGAGNGGNGGFDGLAAKMRAGEHGGRNIRSVWEIATQPYPEAHFATFPEELPRRAIKAGCPEQVCRVCGKPRERIIEREGTYEARKALGYDKAANMKVGEHGGGHGMIHPPGMSHDLDSRRTVTGWTDCGHDDYRPGVVLDPFAGAGTTALVARKLGRHAVGIELNESYCQLIAKRLGQQSLFA